MTRTQLLAGACLVISCARASGEKGSASSATVVDKTQILYAGDSIAAETRSVVAGWTGVLGAELHDSVVPGLALCDFLEDKPEGMPRENKLKERVRTLRPDLV